MKNDIKKIIKQKGVTQKELAKQIGMTEAGLSKAVNGSASSGTLKKVAKALRVPESKLSQVVIARYGSDRTPLRLGNIELPCYVLNNGMRVFSGRGLQNAIGGGMNTSGQWITRFFNNDSIAKNLEPEILEKLNNPILFTRKTAGGSQSETYGYEATLLIDLCDAIIRAYENHELNVKKENYVAANTIIRAVAKVGIIALVDEATGYNKAKDRAKDELQKFLDRFLNEDAAKWVKTFNDTFFEDLYKMHDWSWTKTSKKPGVVGIWINDIVYSRIGPGVKSELEARNPKNEKGKRSYKHHQFLSAEEGLPKLRQHLEALHALAIVANYRWDVFMRLVDKAYPRQYQQYDLFEDFDV